MCAKKTNEHEALKSERAAWHHKAAHYDTYLGAVTKQVVEHLLDAAKVRKHMHVLDVASGPGYGAGFAIQRGAQATGVDFAAGMVEEAQKRFPAARFQEGDGCALSFDAESFDAVICSFGLMHMPNPTKAVGEAFRVLKPSARYAYSLWDPEHKQPFFSLVSSAIEKYGDAQLAPAKNSEAFKFNNHSVCCGILSDAGFVNVKISALQCLWQPRGAEEVLAMLHNSTVKTAALLERQSPQALIAIEKAIVTGAESYRCAQCLQFTWPVIIVSGVKP